MKAHTKVPIAHNPLFLRNNPENAQQHCYKRKPLIYERQDWYEIIYESIMMAQTNIIY